VAHPDLFSAKQAARTFARKLIARGERFEPLFGYECRCGRWHSTRHAQHQGRVNVLLWAVPDDLQVWARGGVSELPD